MKKKAERIIFIASIIVAILLIVFLSIKPFEKIEETSNQNITYCMEEQMNADVCTLEYNPVCGDNNKTYSNPCFACSSNEIEYWTIGSC